jgi:hypothetical protein
VVRIANNKDPHNVAFSGIRLFPPFLGPNIFLGTQFSKTLGLCYSINVGYQVFLKRFIAQKIQRDTQGYQIVPLTNLPQLSFAEASDRVSTLLGMYKCCSKKQVQKVQHCGSWVNGDQVLHPYKIRAKVTSTHKEYINAIQGL